MDEELKPLTPGDLVPTLNPTLVTDGAGLDKVKNYFKRIAEQQEAPEFAADYETNYTKTFYDRRARTLQLGDKNEQYVIDFLHFAGSREALIAGQGNFRTSSWAKPIVEAIEPALNSSKFLKIGQRLDFEYEVSSWCLGFPMWNFYSVDVAERLIWAGLHTFKDVVFYSLAAMIARYFKVRIDKSEQKQFDLETELTESQIQYMCLDLRFPIAIRAMQLPVLRKDNLERICRIENNSLGFFDDIHLNGWNINRQKWEDLVCEWTDKYRDAVKHLDTFFLPVVGPKILTEDVDLEPLKEEWQSQTVESSDELLLKEELKATKDKEQKAFLRAQIVDKAAARKASAAEARKRYTEMKSRVNASKSIAESCQGEASINYSSNAQLLKALRKMKGFDDKNLPSTDDGALKKLKHRPVIAALRDFRTYAKLLETYGDQWIKEYVANPSAEEGWINPGTKKIHTTINPMEAETGRTSSVKPNVQNLVQDERVRSCFIADPPDEEEPEGYVIVTCDMSGAELRIIAEESDSKVWISSFNNGWDVHSVGTELLYPEEWPAGTLPGCAYFEKDHQKCKCPIHKELRDGNKATNFLLAYGGAAQALADAIGKTESEAAALMKKHEAANPDVWAYLKRSGEDAVRNFEARSSCGGRRLFKRPTWDEAKELARERMFESLKSKGKLVLGDGTKLKLEDMYPEKWQISSAFRGMHSSIERRGKNHPIQRLNATIIKLASGCGFDPEGKPYLWHTLPKLKGKAKNMIHDELVIQFPKRNGEAGLELIKDAFKRAGAEFLKKVIMESEGRVLGHWAK